MSDEPTPSGGESRPGEGRPSGDGTSSAGPTRPRDRVEVHRLHPLTVALEVGRVLARLAWFLVVVLVVGSLGGRRTDPGTWLFVLVGSGVVVALVRYLSLRYWIEGGTLVIRSGIVSRHVRTIPLDKIQNVELRQNPLQQLAGVVDFRIETAAGPEAEAQLAVLSADAARRLKGQLLGRQRPQSGEPGAAPRVVVWEAGLGDLVLLGATSNRAGAILGALGGLLVFVLQEVPRSVEALERGLTDVVGVVSPVILAVALLGSTLALGWLLSIGVTVVGYFGFQLTREPDGRLRRRYGLLSRFETVVNPARIQLLRLGASWLRRRLGFWEVAAHTAGSAFEGADSALLCPLLRRDDISGFCSRLLPGLDLDAVDWKPVSRATIRRGFIRNMAVVVLLVAGLAAGGRRIGGGVTSTGRMTVALVALVPGALGAWGLALRRYRVLAHARSAGHLLTRTGVLHRRITIVPESKIQWVGLDQSPFQRRLGIASANVATAAGAARIPDLDEPGALALQRALSTAASAAGAWLPDAV